MLHGCNLQCKCLDVNHSHVPYPTTFQNRHNSLALYSSVCYIITAPECMIVMDLQGMSLSALPCIQMAWLVGAFCQYPLQEGNPKKTPRDMHMPAVSFTCDAHVFTHQTLHSIQCTMLWSQVLSNISELWGLSLWSGKPTQNNEGTRLTLREIWAFIGLDCYDMLQVTNLCLTGKWRTLWAFIILHFPGFTKKYVLSSTWNLNHQSRNDSSFFCPWYPARMWAQTYWHWIFGEQSQKQFNTLFMFDISPQAAEIFSHVLHTAGKGEGNFCILLFKFTKACQYWLSARRW